MEHRRTFGRVTSSAGDVDLNGDVVNELNGRVRECGTSLEPAPWIEGPGFSMRMSGAGADPAAMRRMLKAASR